jgi:hypothetical protein
MIKNIRKLGVGFAILFMIGCVDKEKQKEEWLKPYEGAYKFLMTEVYDDPSNSEKYGFGRLKVVYDVYCGYINPREKKFQVRLIGDKAIKSFPIENIEEKSFEMTVGSVKFKISDLKISEKYISLEYTKNSKSGSAFKTKTPPHDLNACIEELKESLITEINHNVFTLDGKLFIEEEREAYIEKLKNDDF